MKVQRKTKRASQALHRLSPAKGRALLEQAAGELGMSATTFVRRVRQGENLNPDRPRVLRGGALLPFSREKPRPGGRPAHPPPSAGRSPCGGTARGVLPRA